MPERRSLHRLEVPTHIRIAYNRDDNPVVEDYWVETSDDLDRLRELGAQYYVPSRRVSDSSPGHEASADDGSVDGSEPKPKPSDAVSSDIEVNRERYYQALDKLRSAYSRALENRVSFSAMKRKFDTDIEFFIEQARTDPSSLSALIQIEEYDDETFQHSLNVCLFSIFYGEYAGFSLENLKKLAFGALFHDIGKTTVPRGIIRKPEELTASERERIKEHPLDGFEILSELGARELHRRIALEHHERPGGNGYPHGIDSLHPMSWIVAVCDVYEALTASRTYKDPMKPVKAFMVLKDEFSGTTETREIVAGLIRCLGIYPVGSLVKLSNGEEAIVKSVNPEDLRRPVVVVVRDRHGNLLEAPLTLDMKRLADQKKGGHGEVYDDSVRIDGLLTLEDHPELEGKIAKLLERKGHLPIE